MQSVAPQPSAPRLSAERKFIAPDLRAEAAIAILDGLLSADGEYPVNRITSVYYDTPGLHLYAEKSDGDNLKRKVRLRWYSDDRLTATETARAFLEVKFRVGGARHKLRHEVARPRRWLESAPLTDPALIAVLHEANAEQAPWMDPALIPAVCITYARRRYRCPLTGGRVAIDTDIRATRFHPDLFPFGAPIRIAQSVCEFKDAGQAEIPWARHLVDAGFQLRSFSKFGESVRLLLLGGSPS